MQRLDELAEIFVPVIVVGELRYGAYKSSNAERNMQQLELFLSNCKLINLNDTTANFYGKIKAELLKKGKPIPENDIWIAAVAQQYHFPLFTTDSHFTEVNDLMLF